jgi:hypothetical protein
MFLLVTRGHRKTQAFHPIVDPPKHCVNHLSCFVDSNKIFQLCATGSLPASALETLATSCQWHPIAQLAIYVEIMTDTALMSFSPSAVSTDVAHAEFLKHLQWADDADPEWAELAEAGDEKGFWGTLTKTQFGLREKSAQKRSRALRTPAAMSLWSRGLFIETETESQLAVIWSLLAERIEKAQEKAASHHAQKKTKSASGKNGKASPAQVKIPRKQVKALAEYLDAVKGQPPSAWELLLLADLLWQAGKSLPAKVGLPLWRRLVSAAGEYAEAAEDAEKPLKGIIAGELPWVLGLLLGDLSGSEILLNRGRKFLQSELEDHTDTDGTLRAQEMERLTEWLPPFVRAAEWGRASETPLWNDATEERFADLIKRVSACYAGDGHLAFDQNENPIVLPMLLTGARITGCSKKEWPLKYLLDIAEARPDWLDASKSSKHVSKLKTSRRRAALVDVDDLIQQSDWAKLACLRNHAGRDADVLAVMHHQTLPKLDFSILGHGVIQGPWELEVSFDQKPLDQAFDWICVCWHTDSDGDYLELQHTIDENRRIERQVFLSRTDHFLVLADCISGAGDAVIDYAMRLPLVEHAEVSRSDDTRECTVSLADARMRTFPLALPEQIVQSTSGRWGLSQNRERPCLELRQTAQGGLYAPVVFEWTPARQNSDAQWRTLTVTENGPRVKSDRAAGHRLKIGNQQLLIYRSLIPGELRTVLGHHTGQETVIARFNKNGDVKPLLIVE